MATIAPLLQRDGAFAPHEIVAMSMALDDVCKELQIYDDPAARETIAIRIIELAQRGERSPTGYATACFWKQAAALYASSPVTVPPSRRAASSARPAEFRRCLSPAWKCARAGSRHSKSALS